MPPPSPLAIATSSLQRLIKEEASYHAELKQEQARVERLEDSANESVEEEDEKGNREFRLRQERQAMEETRKIFPGLRERIAVARETLKSQLEAGGGTEEEAKKAEEVLQQGGSS